MHVLDTLAGIFYLEYRSLRVDQSVLARPQAQCLCFAPDQSRLHRVAIVPGFISFLVMFH